MCLESSALARSDLAPLTTLLLGIGEGVAAQALVDPAIADVDEVFALLDEMLHAALGGEAGPEVLRLRETVDRASGPPAPPADDEPDPVADLSPVAANLLAAARHVLGGRGFRALTLDAIAERAGEPRSAVSYYFGDKQGLVDRLHAATLYDNRALVRRAVARLPGGDARVPAVIAAQEPLLAGLSAFRRHYELLPVVLRDDALRIRHADHLRWLCDTTATCLAGSDDPGRVRRLRALASLMIAAPSGLAIQRLVAPHDVDPALLLGVWTRIVVASLHDSAPRLS
jgi:AcrR family transcriptional regulator